LQGPNGLAKVDGKASGSFLKDLASSSQNFIVLACFSYSRSAIKGKKKDCINLSSLQKGQQIFELETIKIIDLQI